MKLRNLKKSDIIFCSNIVGKAFSKDYINNSKKELAEMFTDTLIKPKYIVAEENKKIIGFGGYIQAFMDYEVYQLFWVCVLPEFQRQGVGTKIVDRLIKEIKKIRGKHKKAKLIQLTTSKPEFYEKRFGFKIIQNLGKNSYLMSLSCK